MSSTDRFSSPDIHSSQLQPDSKQCSSLPTKLADDPAAPEKEHCSEFELFKQRLDAEVAGRTELQQQVAQLHQLCEALLHQMGAQYQMLVQIDSRLTVGQHGQPLYSAGASPAPALPLHSNVADSTPAQPLYSALASSVPIKPMQPNLDEDIHATMH